MRFWTDRALLALLILVVLVAFGCEKKAEKGEEKAEPPAPEQAQPEAEEEAAKAAASEQEEAAKPAAEEGPDVPAEAVAADEVAGAEDQEPSATEEAPKAQQAPAMLLIGAQVMMLDEAGEQMGVLTDMPTLTARFGPNRSSVILLSEGAHALYEIPLTDDEPRHIADLPTRFTLEEEAPELEAGSVLELLDLDLQSASDFWVHEGTACITLMDRNANMANVAAEIAIDLASGEVETKVNSVLGAANKPAACAQRPPHPKGGACGYTINEQSQLLKADTQALVSPIGVGEDFMIDGVSPTGKWATLIGNLSEGGDYIDMELLLLNCENGEVFPVQEEGWGVAIPVAELPEIDLETTGTLSINGETSVRWMPGVDKLVVAGMVVEPGVGTKSFDGELVF